MNVEYATFALFHFGLDAEFTLQLRSQTGRFGKVVSLRAVLDLDFH